MIRGIAAISAVVALAGSAQAAFFSFASDPKSGDAWTFHNGGQPAKIFDENPAAAPTKTFTLWYDDDNGPLPAKSIDVTFNADFQIASRVSTGATGIPGKFMHTYRLSVSNFEFFDATTGASVLRIDFFDAFLTAVGSANTWDQTATIQGGDKYGFVQYTAGFSDLPYGIAAGKMGGPMDFAFTLTELNMFGTKPLGPVARGVDLDPTTGLPTGRWWSEGSYSGAAYLPAPGAVALLGLAGLTAARRRR